jgi:hypothetical protein
MDKYVKMTGRRSAKIHFHTLMEILDDVDKNGHYDSLKEFLRTQNAHVMINPNTVNLVKKYVADNNLYKNKATPLMSKVIIAPPCPPGTPPGGHCPLSENE